MRKISLDSVQPGMVLAKAILGSEGQVLLNAGVEIKPQYLVYLKNMGIHALYVQDDRLDDVEVLDVVSEETRLEARFLVKEIMKEVQSGAYKKGLTIYEKQITRTVSMIVMELLENKDMVIQLMDIRAQEDYLFAHSVNVCIMATLIAAKINFSKEMLKQLATGCLLHDLGLISIPKNVLNKKGCLTRDEFETVKNHPVYGYELFKKSPIFSARAGMVILQHHERFQGQGYPHGLRGDKINLLAQIAAVADVYDALTSERPYRKAFQPHEATEMLMSYGNDLFELEILKLFLQNIAAFPLGTHVQLSNGESGLVVALSPGFALRPTVRVLYVGEDMAPHPAPYDLNLSQVMDVVIVKVIA